MGDRSAIEWTEASWNPIRGCSRVSEGCRYCYAERVAARFSGGAALEGRELTDADKPYPPYHGLAVMTKAGPRWTGEVRLVPEALDLPSRWRKPRRIFVNSMSDLFHEKVPDEWIDRIFDVMYQAERHSFQVLTKRPERMRAWCIQSKVRGLRLTDKPLPNVWLGVSVEDQATADERIPLLLQTPAAIRWVSYEPALGAVDFKRWLAPEQELDADYRPAHTRRAALDWLVVGGESGPGARPFNVAWARSVIAQCRAAGVACFVKQLGAVIRDSDHHYVGPGMPWPAGTRYVTDGAGGLLDVKLRHPKGGAMEEWPADLRVREYPGALPGREGCDGRGAAAGD